MVAQLSPEEKAVGTGNANEALGIKRRDFLKGILAAGVASGAGLGAAYFGYGASVGNPVRAGIIGTGDEGGILIGALTPSYIEIGAIADIRKFNQHRAFHGDFGNDDARPGLMKKYGWTSEDEAKRHVTVYQNYEDLLKDKTIEAVIIATPLHLHHEMAIKAMRAGKHVLTEKLMGHDIGKCKDMARVAAATGKLLATGHQRHYSVLYDNAVHLLRWGLLGELHHIRAQWHRGTLPGKDQWRPPLPGGEMIYDDKGQLVKFDQILHELNELKTQIETAKTSKASAALIAQLEKKAAQWAANNADRDLKAENYGYVEMDVGNRKRSALEELIRWRIWDRTGGGLMAELGSHQLDASSIFCSAMRQDGKKAHPIAVHAVSGRHTFPLDRDADDHVYCTFEFPGPGYAPEFDVGYRDPTLNYPNPKTGVPSYEEDRNKRIVVTYSSINGNGYGSYGEVVMGTKGTLILEREKELMLFKGDSTSTKVTVKQEGAAAVMSSYETGGGAAAPLGASATTGPVSRGYTEEIEHWCWCIKNPSPENLPRCKPEVALGDAVMALTARLAGKNAAADKGGYIRFQEEWFDWKNDATPDGSKPEEKATGVV